MSILTTTGVLAETPWYSESINVESKVGTDRSIQSLDIMYPLSHTNSSLTFTDLRGRVDNDQSVEVNLGLGHRSVVANPLQPIGGDEAVVGVYGFADRLESEFDNVFYQATAGFEYFTRDYSLRLNGYYPEDKREPTTTFTQLRATGTQIFFEERQNFERPLPGYDVELGKTLRFDGWQLYGRGSYFRFHHSDVTEVEGSRFRAGVQFNGSHPKVYLPEGSQLTLGAEWQNDQVRDEQTFGVARLSIPFGGEVSGVRGQVSGNNNSESRTMNSGLSAWQKDRLSERVERDVDIVTGQPDNGSVADTTPAQLAGTNRSLNNVIFVTSNGDSGLSPGQTTPGTFENPASLEVSETLAQKNSSILIMSSDTVTINEFTLSTGQALIGGSSLVLETPDGSNRQTLDLTNASGRPTIDGLTDQPTVQLDTGASDLRIENVRITGSGDAIKSNQNTDVKLQNLVIDNEFSGEDGIQVNNPSGRWTLHNLDVSAENDAIHIDGGTANHTLTDLTVSSNSGQGVEVLSTSGGTFTFRNSQITSSGDDGIHLDGVSDATLADLTISNAGNRGLDLLNPSGDWSLRNLDVSAQDDGIRVSGGTANHTLTDLTVSSSNQRGIDVTNPSGGKFVLTNSQIKSTGKEGVFLKKVTGGTIANLSIKNTGKNGIDLINSDTMFLNNLTIKDVGRHALFTETDVDNLTLLNSTANNPSDNGFLLWDLDGGTVRNLRVDNAARAIGLNTSQHVKADSLTVNDADLAMYVNDGSDSATITDLNGFDVLRGLSLEEDQNVTVTDFSLETSNAAIKIGSSCCESSNKDYHLSGTVSGSPSSVIYFPFPTIIGLPSNLDTISGEIRHDFVTKPCNIDSNISNSTLTLKNPDTGDIWDVVDGNPGSCVKQ